MDNILRTLDAKIQLRTDIAENWFQENPVLLAGELGLESDTNRFKFGDGITTWISLPYSASPAVAFNSPPGPSDWNHLPGTVGILNRERPFILVSTAVDSAVWVELTTSTDISDAMFRSLFATNINWEHGYVDKAMEATHLSNQRSFSIIGDVIAANVYFDGMQNVQLNAALREITDLAGGGTFTKVIVDNKGRVVGHEHLLPEDIPNLTLDHISDAGTAAGRNIGVAIGQVVVVGPGGYIDPAIMPAIAITNVYVVDSDDAMVALNATQGDVAIRTDLNKSFILVTSPAADRENWVELQMPTNAIQLINGIHGPYVTLTTDDISEGDNNLYHTSERVVTTMATQASTILTDGERIVRDTDTLILNGGNATSH